MQHVLEFLLALTRGDRCRTPGIVEVRSEGSVSELRLPSESGEVSYGCVDASPTLLCDGSNKKYRLTADAQDQALNEPGVPVLL